VAAYNVEVRRVDVDEDPQRSVKLRPLRNCTRRKGGVKASEGEIRAIEHAVQCWFRRLVFGQMGCGAPVRTDNLSMKVITAASHQQQSATINCDPMSNLHGRTTA
jgi:hypothetical protein